MAQLEVRGQARKISNSKSKQNQNSSKIDGFLLYMHGFSVTWKKNEEIIVISEKKECYNFFVLLNQHLEDKIIGCVTFR